MNLSVEELQKHLCVNCAKKIKELKHTITKDMKTQHKYNGYVGPATSINIDLRSWFAGMATKDLVSQIPFGFDCAAKVIAARAYEVADELLKIR